MKIGIVGVGGMGGCHFNIYNDIICKNMNDVELSAACDVRLDMLKEKAKGINIRLYDDYDEMLEKEEFDIIDVSTPTYLHKEHSIKALKKGINVICEKPMALNSAEAAEIIQAAKESGKLFMAAHVVRFMNPYMYLEDVIKSHKYGNLIKLYMKRISSTPLWSYENWMMDKSKSGHAALDLSIHDIDFMQSVLGEPDDVSGTYYEMKDTSNYISANYIYKNCSVSVEGAWFKADIPFSAEFSAIFENGYVDFKNNRLSDNGNDIDFENPEAVENTGINISSVGDGYSSEIMYFIDCVKKGVSPAKVTPESSLKSISIVEKTLNNLKKI